MPAARRNLIQQGGELACRIRSVAHVNNHDGHTIAARENRQLARTARTTGPER